MAQKKPTKAKTKKTAVKKPAAKRKVVKKVAKKTSPNKAKKAAPARKAPAAKATLKPAANLNVLTDITALTDSLNSIMNVNNQPMEDMMSKSKTQYDQLANDAANISREGIEAFTKSTGIFTKGFEEIMRASVGLAQEAAEKQAQIFQQALGSKSINEFAEIQNDVAKKSYDEFVANATKISEMSVKTLTEASQPIQDQINKAVQKASQSMAA